MNSNTLWKAFNPVTILSDVKSLNVKQGYFMSGMLAVMLGLMLYWGESTISIIASLTGVICVVLVNLRKLSNYFWGTINAVFYGYVAYRAAYYGDSMLNFMFYLPIQFIGAYFWSKSMNDGIVESKKLNLVSGVLVIMGIGVSILAYSLFLISLNGNLALIDSCTTVLSIAATILMVKCYREQWICWIVVNILSIYMWYVNFQLNQDGIGILVMWSIFLINSIYGLYSWSKTTK